MLLAIALLLDLSTLAPFQDDSARELKPETGSVTVGGSLATMDLPEGWTYLQKSDARYVVEDLWGNPPDSSVVGLVSPDAEDANWAIIVSVEDDGHVDDSDVDDLDYDELLASMQDDTKAANKERKREGYPTAVLQGWAEAPHYDKTEKKLYWAKRLTFSDAQGDTLNYDVRILGRNKVLVLSAIGNIEDLAAMSEGAKAILAVTDFTDGNRYADYDPKIDKLAAYGIGGLIAGKVLLKVGFFALIAKSFKFILIGIVALGVFLKRMLTGKSGKGGTDANETLPVEPVN